jgi:hypothetical protein
MECLVEMLQVDLKLNICRGTSVWKILVREAKAYSASKIIENFLRIKKYGLNTIRPPEAVGHFQFGY